MFRRWFFLIWALARLFFSFIQTMGRLQRGVEAPLGLADPYSLTGHDKRRVRHYCLGATYLEVLFCSIRGKRSMPLEQQLLFKLSALASFFDDLVDNQRGKIPELHTAPADPLAFGQAADERHIAQHLLQNILQKLPQDRQPLFQAYLQRVYAVEMKGQNFPGNVLNINQLKKITAEKGGCSVMLFRSLFGPQPGKQEENALLEFGYLLQLADDIFDLWFDYVEKVTTVATSLVPNGGVGALEEIFEQQLDRTKKVLSAIPVSKWRIQIALALVHGLTAITRTCLRRYRYMQEKYVELPLGNRKLMVTDMEKWSNRWQACGYLFLST